MDEAALSQASGLLAATGAACTMLSPWQLCCLQATARTTFKWSPPSACRFGQNLVSLGFRGWDGAWLPWGSESG